MKVAVLCGSPKKEFSASTEFARFLQKKFDHISFEFHEISSRIKEIENSPDLFNSIMNSVKNSEIVIWTFPVYTYLVPGQYKKFIELIFEKNAEVNFAGKNSCVLTTSIHLYDNTAIKYMEAISMDLGMSYFDYFSAQQMQLAFFNNQYKIIHFFETYLRAVENKVLSFSGVAGKNTSQMRTAPVTASKKIDNKNAKIVILTDGYTEYLKTLIDAFQNSLMIPADIIDLTTIDMKGGCAGCLQCSFENKCSFTDGFRNFYDLMSGYDGYVFAGGIKDRFLGHRWKEVLDRLFFRNHVPIFKRKQLGVLVDKPVNDNFVIREYFDEYHQIQEANFCGYCSPDNPNAGFFAEKMVSNIKNKYFAFASFYGVGGKKIDRDFVNGRGRYIFRADHAYYSKNKYYDFPYKDLTAVKRNFLTGLLMYIKPMRTKMQKGFNKKLFDIFTTKLYEEE